MLGEATKYTVLGIFVLYSLGYLIWHSYLGEYGVSSIGFLQTEYLSAAFCYLMLLTVIAVPPAALLEHWRSGWQSNSKQTTRDAGSLYVIICIWYSLCQWLKAAFFPGKPFLTQ